MIDLYTDGISCTDYLLTLARQFKTRVNGDSVIVPSDLGNGFFKSVELSNGISLIMSDTCFREDVLLTLQPVPGEYYLLQFHEVIEAPTLYSTPKIKAHNLLKQMVLLTPVAQGGKFFVPATARLVSYQVIFRKSHITSLVPGDVLDEIFEKYFETLEQPGNIDPLQVSYRAVLKELMVQHLSQPLGMNFLQNRIMLLMEKFLVRIASENNVKPETQKFSDNELVRLMKIESMLVNDFSVTPPNINYLSRISAMSPTKLKSDFKKMYGMPIYEYYQKNRMQRAKALLLEGKYSIKEIGIKVGYSNLSHFAGSFRKEFGMLPSEMLARDGALAM